VGASGSEARYQCNRVLKERLSRQLGFDIISITVDNNGGRVLACYDVSSSRNFEFDSLQLQSRKMPTNTLTQGHTLNTVLLVLILIAIFPGLPQYLLLFPFRLLFSRPSTPIPAITCPPGCTPDIPMMAWSQKTFTLPPKSRGSYLVTDEVVKNLPEIKDYKIGLLNLFVQHTSCALSLNENWDSDVREDMSDALDRIAPEDKKGNLYRHSAEGLDDMPVSESEVGFKDKLADQ